MFLDSFLRSNAARIAILVGIALFSYFLFLKAENDGLRSGVEQQAQTIRTAEAQITLDAKLSERLDHLVLQQHQIEVTLSHATQQIQASPHANDLVPSDIANAWYSGIIELRGDTAPTLRTSDSLLDTGVMPFT